MEPSNRSKRFISLGVGLGAGVILFFLSTWYYKNYISVWYYATIQQAYLPIKVTIRHCEAKSFKSKNSSTATYSAECECFYKTSIGNVIETSFHMGEDKIKNLEALQIALNKTYYDGKEVEVLVHPHYPDLLIISYEEVRLSSWFGVTAGGLMFLIVWVPCLIMVIFCINAFIYPKKVDES
jgi:Protein of unknown function (DUF3592)